MNTLTRRDLLGAGGSAALLLALSSCARRGKARGSIGVVLTNGTSGLVVQEIARTQGYFDEFGVRPTSLLVTDGSKCVAALVSGASEVCIYSGFNQVIPAIERGARLKILAGAMALSPLLMYSGRPEITKVEDLTGKTIGIGAVGAVLYQMTVLLLEKKGVSAGSVKFRNVGSAADVLKAVAAGTLDAGLGDVDVFGQQQQFGIHALSDGMLWKEIPEYTNQASYASDTAIQSHREALVRILAAFGKAYRFISGPESRSAYVSEWLRITGNADATQAITQWNWIQQNQPYDLNLLLSDQQIDYVQRTNVQFDAQKHVLPLTQVADMSLAHDALKLLV